MLCVSIIRSELRFAEKVIQVRIFQLRVFSSVFSEIRFQVLNFSMDLCLHISIFFNSRFP